MNKSIPLFTLFNVRITFTPLCVISYLILVPPLAWLGIKLRDLSLIESIVASLFIIDLMFVSENIHQLGHAWAARSVGYPMIGVRHFSWFSACLYPKDEPELSPQIHIKRALGGFWINLVIGLVLAGVAYAIWNLNGVAAFTVVTLSVWNFFVLGAGALLPIDYNGFTVDGGTILKQWRRIKEGE